MTENWGGEARQQGGTGAVPQAQKPQCDVRQAQQSNKERVGLGSDAGEGPEYLTQQCKGELRGSEEQKQVATGLAWPPWGKGRGLTNAGRLGKREKVKQTTDRAWWRGEKGS